jgi:hypothetical protein
VLLSKSSSAAPVGDAVEGAAVGGAVEGDAVGAATAIIGACDVGAPVAALPPVGKRVGDAFVGDLVVGTGILVENVGIWSVVGIGVVAHTAIWHWRELGTHGCPSRKQNAASTDDSTPCTTIVHDAVDVAVPSPHVAVQDDCSCCTHHPTAVEKDGLR